MWYPTYIVSKFVRISRSYIAKKILHDRPKSIQFTDRFLILKLCGNRGKKSETRQRAHKKWPKRPIIEAKIITFQKSSVSSIEYITSLYPVRMSVMSSVGHTVSQSSGRYLFRLLLDIAIDRLEDILLGSLTRETRSGSIQWNNKYIVDGSYTVWLSVANSVAAD